MAKLLRRMVPRDGVEPPPPAFSGLAKAAKWMISKKTLEYKGTLRNLKEPLMFLYCSFATERLIF